MFSIFLSVKCAGLVDLNFIRTGVKGSSTKVKGSNTIDYFEEVPLLPATDTTVGVFSENNILLLCYIECFL